MTLVSVKKIQLQKDSTSLRSKFVEGKIQPLHDPTKLWSNPAWPLPTNDEVVEIDGLEYNENEVIKLLDKAGADLKNTNSSINSGKGIKSRIRSGNRSAESRISWGEEESCEGNRSKGKGNAR